MYVPLIYCFLLFSKSQEEKHLSDYLIEPVKLNVIIKRRLNLEKSDLPLIEVEGNLELFKVYINRVGKFLKKQWCCVGGEYNKIIWFYLLG